VPASEMLQALGASKRALPPERALCGPFCSDRQGKKGSAAERQTQSPAARFKADPKATVLGRARMHATAAVVLLWRQPFAWLLALAISLLSSAVAASADPVILNPNRYDVLVGRFSVFAKFQLRLQRLLEECGKPEPAVIAAGKQSNGKIGQETRQGIISALACEALREVPVNSPAREGVLTQSVWRAVMGEEPLPTARDRAAALVLSFEGTDFGELPEWNFCQDNAGSLPRQGNRWAPDFVCYNASDPCAFLTWGPRGATAGLGREIQLILWMIFKQDPGLIERAFATEAGNLKRFFRLKGGGNTGCYMETPLKRFLCAIWMDPARNARWESALLQLGRDPSVREAYARLYAMREFDGDKLRGFFELWQRLGLTPSEVDYAFFLDRITHLGGPLDQGGATAVERLRACMRQEGTAISANGAGRRCLARNQPHETQPAYRLGRDVAYYLGPIPKVL
jgi:hypothetical protein